MWIVECEESVEDLWCETAGPVVQHTLVHPEHKHIPEAPIHDVWIERIFVDHLWLDVPLECNIWGYKKMQTP